MFDPTAPALPCCACCDAEFEPPVYDPWSADGYDVEAAEKCAECLSRWDRIRDRGARTRRRRSAMRAAISGRRAERAAAAERRAADGTLSTLAPAGTRRAIANATRAVAMREAHAEAAAGSQSVPYAARLAAALRNVYARPRRCALSSLRRQALAWAAAAHQSGARFDVTRKAAGAVAFSAAHDLRSLAIPSKLYGTRAFQPAADTLSSRLATRGGWALVTVDHAHTVTHGAQRLGSLQDKHAAWISAIGSVRVAATAVTGGQPITDRHGNLTRTTRGVNIALEVGDAAEAWALQSLAPKDDPTARLQRLQEELAELF